MRPLNNSLKQFAMKKFFALMIAAAAFTACNDNTHSAESTNDTTVVEQSAPDTTIVRPDTTTTITPDTTVVKPDTTHAK